MEDTNVNNLFSGYGYTLNPIEFYSTPANGCISSEKGLSPQMNDTFLICDMRLPSLSNPVKIYAIFDGHGGNEIAIGSRDYLPEIIREKLLRVDIEITYEVIEAIKAAFYDLDFLLFEKNYSGGSTVTLVLQINTRIYIANLGDTRSLLFNETGTIIIATRDHKPSLSEERERIMSNGYSVINENITYGNYRGPRVSRSLGDYQIKINMRTKQYLGEKAAISPIPDVYTYMIEEPIKIILGSSGFWEKYGNLEITRLILSLPNHDDTCSYLTSDAIYSRATPNNVTIMILNFTI